MKITGVKIEKLLLELTSPFRVAFGTITHSENVMIKVTTDEGVTGYGEAAPLAFVTAETTDSVLAALELFRTGLIGMDPLDIEAVHAMMDGLMGGNSSAKCAVDLAMYDIRGKAAGMPVYKLLGGYSNTVLNDITVSIMEPQAMADKALSYVRDKGYRVLKVKVGADVNDDIRALTLIREAVGPDVRLRVDANQGYDVPTALKALNAFAALGVESVEQCLPAWNMEGAAYLRRKAPAIHLMLDESIHGPVDAARACRMDAADILNIKLMNREHAGRPANVSGRADQCPRPGQRPHLHGRLYDGDKTFHHCRPELCGGKEKCNGRRPGQLYGICGRRDPLPRRLHPQGQRFCAVRRTGFRAGHRLLIYRKRPCAGAPAPLCPGGRPAFSHFTEG